MASPKTIKAYQIIRNNGLGFCAFRAQYALRKKFGLLKRKFPSRPWSQITLGDMVKQNCNYLLEDFIEIHQSNGRRFFFASDNLPKPDEKSKKKIAFQAEQILQNKFRYFFDKSYLLGDGPDWFLNPITGQCAKSERHWCDIDMFDPDVGDIKFIWEPSRFAWVYTLVRAYAVTADNKYAEKFWQLFESWLDANQPNMSPNYACGQECAIRLMAMCLGFYGFAEATATTTQRQTKLAAAIAMHADRIEKNIDFAISTRTNHSLTESAGLYTAGLLFPEFQRSEHWLKLGKKVLTNEGLKQIYPDGAYIQHSMNYHRLMLQDFLWVLRLAQLNSDSFCDELTSRVAKAAEFLYQMQDEVTGRVPNYGANDGALIMPLNNCDYLDYRPIIQSIHYLFNKTRLYKPGPWDEDLLWMFGDDAANAPIVEPPRKSSKYQTGGYYTLRSNDSWAMMRCHSYSDRPGHADMLHLDLWWKGVNVLRDSGSFMYNCVDPWQDYFGSTAAHNTIVIDQSDQMTKTSRFMWFDWTKAKFIMHKDYASGGVEIIQGEHYSYCRKNNKIVHRRSILSLPDGCWLIVDDILGSKTHRIGLHWQICDLDYELIDNTLIIRTEHGPASLAILDSAGKSRCKCFKGDDKPIGWQSLYYGNRELAPTLVCSARVDLPVRFVTLVSLGDVANGLVFGDDDAVSWRLDKSGEGFIVRLNPIADSGKRAFNFVEHASEKLSLD